MLHDLKKFGRAPDSDHAPQPRYGTAIRVESRSESVRLAPVLAKRSRPSTYTVDAIPALLACGERGALADSSVASSPPARPCLASAYYVRVCADRDEDVSSARELLRSKRHAVV